MLKNIMIYGAVGAVMLANAFVIQAATLSVVGGNDVQLDDGFSLGVETGLSSGMSVKEFNWSNAKANNGLQISGTPAEVTFTYLGSDAYEQNRFILSQDVEKILFDTTTANTGDVQTGIISNDSAMPFYFQNENGKFCVYSSCFWDIPDSDATNNGAIEKLLSIAFFQESATSVIALFGDGSGDHDYDDMAVRISVTAVPLPPAMLLFGGALFGLRWISRRRLKVA